MLRSAIICSGLLLAGAVAFSAPAQALSMKECGEKYQAAKTANTLNGQSWTEFRKTQCATNAAAPAAPAAAGTSTTMPASPPAATTAAKPAPATTTAAKPMAPAPANAGNVVFPTAIAPEFSSLSAGKARLKTCSKQYQANKATGGNGELKWIQKGGGYWSECNKHLKG